jgi:hypothetical protein
METWENIENDAPTKYPPITIVYRTDNFRMSIRVDGSSNSFSLNLSLNSVLIYMIPNMKRNGVPVIYLHVIIMYGL